MSLTDREWAVATATKGFLPDDEAEALHAAALGADGPFLEVGSYCGRSTVWLGAAARARGTVLFAVDHHRGSEENQAGWEWHDPEVVDPATGRIDTLPFLRRTLAAAGLEDVVVPVVGASATVGHAWATPVGFLFVDGGHAHGVVLTDEAAWLPHVRTGGLLAIHDVFADPADGGRPPFELYRRCLGSGAWQEVAATGSLRVLRRGPSEPDGGGLACRPMEQRLSLVTLGVADVPRARTFYEQLGWRGQEVEETVFFEASGVVLVLWGRDRLAADAGVADSDPAGFGGLVLAHNVRSEDEVARVLAAAEAAGATVTRPAGRTFYGGFAACFADPDGHVWEVAHNPGFALADDGSVILPDFGAGA